MKREEDYNFDFDLDLVEQDLQELNCTPHGTYADNVAAAAKRLHRIVKRYGIDILDHPDELMIAMRREINGFEDI